ncbi:MAG TPA: HAMP domain-containing sensor histidine kinase [Gemmatimonadaceae bacterium]|nr:HAMP domain-containing sensor histidine kinase [Gemmatimonadaceae bacterium]
MSLWTNILERADLRSRERRAASAHREAMRALQEALSAAESAQKTRDQFLARMSHELRTPLNAVIGLSRVLEKNSAGNMRPEDLHLLGRVRAGGEQLLRLVEDVLDQSRIEGGGVPLAISDADVVGIATNVVKQYRSAAAAKGLRMLPVLPESAPTVRLDPGRFEQVLTNLVDNAVKFTVSGDVKVTLASDAATRKPTRMIVSDTGIGIPEDQLDVIFQPFQQVDASARRSFGGAGLGLPLARQLCEGMGCRLTVESESGRGSRFTIRFPGA